MGKSVVFTCQYPPYLSGLKNGSTITPQAGRFYPKGLLKDITGIFPENIEPFRCLMVSNDHITVDFNHSLCLRSGGGKK